MNNAKLEQEKSRLNSQLRRKDEIIYKLKLDKIVIRKEVVIVWIEIYRICGLNDELKKNSV